MWISENQAYISEIYGGLWPLLVKGYTEVAETYRGM